MRRFAVLVALVAVSFMNASDLTACGDNLLLLGQGVKITLGGPGQQLQTILLYRNAVLGNGAAVNDGTLERALKRVGYTVRSVKDLNQLTQEVKSAKKLDMIVADPSDESRVRQSISAFPVKPQVVATSVPAKAKEAQYVAMIDNALKTGSR